MIGIKEVQKYEEVRHLFDTSTRQMKALGFTEHSYRHSRLVSNACGEMLERLGEDPRTVELGRIAGYLHDIGNAVNRVHHSQYGAILAYELLLRMGMLSKRHAGLWWRSPTTTRPTGSRSIICLPHSSSQTRQM